MKRSIYCGGPAAGLVTWLAALRIPGHPTPAWPQLDGRVVVGTFRGRTAVSMACRAFGLGRGDEILVPAYNCGTEIDALIHAGVKPVAFRVSAQCVIDFEDLRARRTNRTKAVYVIHYFGWEQPLAELRVWCDQHGLRLIEDCALALFSSGPSGNLGKVGDAAIYSLPKTLGVAHGGLLSLKTDSDGGMPSMRPAGMEILFDEIRCSARDLIYRALDHSGLYGAVASIRSRVRDRSLAPVESNPLPDMPGGYYFRLGQDDDRMCHPKVLALASLLQWEGIVRARRANYARLAAAFEGLAGARMLFASLPAGVCPLSMPLLVPNRDACARRLQAQGIGAIPWWAGFHRGAVDWSSFREACELKRGMVTVPVHQGLRARQLDDMAAIVSNTLGRNDLANGSMTASVAAKARDTVACCV